MPWEHPDLGRFRERVAESSELHKSTISPRDDYDSTGRIIIHGDGRLNPDEKSRVVQEEAARIRRALGDA